MKEREGRTTLTGVKKECGGQQPFPYTTSN